MPGTLPGTIPHLLTTFMGLPVTAKSWSFACQLSSPSEDETLASVPSEAGGEDETLASVPSEAGGG